MSKEEDQGGTKTPAVAVIGGGIFGCTAAIELARAGFKTTLFEAGHDIMQAASGINQYRMHKGYHYPRSDETIRSCMDSTPLFEAEYKDAIIAHLTHYYAIAKEGSKVDGTSYLETLARHNLPHDVVMPPHINASMVDVVVKADENLYDPALLREVVRTRLHTEGVVVHFNTRVSVDDLADFDFVVVATYARLNEAFGSHTGAHRDYQYEVCEKIVVEIPDELKGISTVIMDGPFMCFDPLGDTGYAVMGHVEHAIHERSVGTHATIPEAILPYLNAGVVTNPNVTNAAAIIADGARFIPALANARHVGSMFTIRTVLPKVDHTDERPTIVRAIDDRMFMIYSGKIGNSVKAARDVVAHIRAKLA
jgi:glycine/D-amino acid oxidase-like deaminating enzyme